MHISVVASLTQQCEVVRKINKHLIQEAALFKSNVPVSHRLHDAPLCWLLNILHTRFTQQPRLRPFAQTEINWRSESNGKYSKCTLIAV